MNVCFQACTCSDLYLMDVCLHMRIYLMHFKYHNYYVQ